MGALIVFLPGLMGNEKTWGIIPSLIKRTPGTDFEVATLTYSTGIFSPSDLSRSAAVILTSLENKYAAYSPIYLVGHSLGGLVAREICRQLLVADSSKDTLLDTVQAVITLGTPIEGAKPLRFSSLQGAWNAILSKTPFLGRKLKQIGDPRSNFERYKAAVEQRIQIQKDDPLRKARRPKQIHIEIEDDLAVVGNTKKFHTIDDAVGGTVSGNHRNFAQDAEQATHLADLIISLIRNVQNAANPAHSPPLTASAEADLPSVLVLFACSRTKAPGGEKGHDGSTPAESVLPLELRRRIMNKRSNVYGLIKDGKIIDAFEKGSNRVHQRANQSLELVPVVRTESPRG
jgi:pimeloyl-ACP methyl ester carboxylesterase